MFTRILTIVTLFAALALLLFVQSTSPVAVGPGGILTVFFLLYLLITGVATWGIYLGGILAGEVKKFARSTSSKEFLTFLHAYYYGSVVAMGVIMMIAINSVGSLGIYEIGLVMLFVAIGIFYLTKRL